jgi:hypothetical protein
LPPGARTIGQRKAGDSNPRKAMCASTPVPAVLLGLRTPSM